MKHSENSSEKQSKKSNNILMWLFVAVSFLGFLDATYLTVAHFTGTSLKCGVFDACEIVTTSKYSEILGIPVALLGALYYLGILFISLLYIDTKHPVLTKILAPYTIAGFLTSIYLIYIQLGILHSICPYCMVSAVTSTVLFVLGMVLWRKNK